jgi:hypothetical protein
MFYADTKPATNNTVTHPKHKCQPPNTNNPANQHDKIETTLRREHQGLVTSMIGMLWRVLHDCLANESEAPMRMPKSSSRHADASVPDRSGAEAD